MAYWIYSSEALPNPDMMGKPGYTPDAEFIRWGGLTLPPLDKNKWTKLPEILTTSRRQSWRDPKQEVEIHISKFKGIINANFAKRGVIFMDHEPTAEEKARLETLSEDLNKAWRKECIQLYEDQVREKEVTGHGRTKPTPYEDECYSILNMTKPYSPEHFQAQRNPGMAAAQQIANAISESQKNLVSTLVDVLTKPQKPAVAATK